MSQLYRIEDYRAQSHRIFFDRNELNQLLSLYSQQVIAGQWRDYAIDQTETTARFSVFRHTNDLPLYSIEKARSRKGWEFSVMNGRSKVSTTASLSKALLKFRKTLRVVS